MTFASWLSAITAQGSSFAATASATCRSRASWGAVCGFFGVILTKQQPPLRWVIA